MQLFVSDLHLSVDRPDKLELFQRFAARAAQVASKLYILGDLFEVWLGDDDDTPEHRAIVEALAGLSAAGVAVYFIHGNRDFLCGADFSTQTGATLLPDYATIELDGQCAVLTHGDLLCTRDVKYQRFRRVVRHPLVRRLFLAVPLASRRRIAFGTRTRTVASMESKDTEIMDVDSATVAEVLRRHAATLLIHGHTHRPAMHAVAVDGRACQRVVIGDWYCDDDVLIYDNGRLSKMRVGDFVATDD